MPARRTALKRTEWKRTTGPRGRGIDAAVSKHPASGTAAELRRNRELAFKRDNWTCRLSGNPGHECDGRLVAHHIVLRSQGGTHAVENLATLCDEAHRWVHDHPAEARLLGLYGRRTEEP